MTSYPKINDEEFYDKINKKYKKYTIPKKKGTFNQICFPKEYQLQIPQNFLAQYISPKTPYRGVLIFHRIGAGKTCTAVNIAEQWKNERNIIIVTPAALMENFREELRSPCAGNAYLKADERNQLSMLRPTDAKYKEIMEKSNARIEKYYNIMSYNKFMDNANEGKMRLRNTLLVVDEVQNMVSEGGIYYKTLYEAIHNAPVNLRVVLLSATPMFDKPIEIALTMNLLRIPFELPIGKEFENMFIKTTISKKTGRVSYKAINLDIFKERIVGYVSYFRGAPIYAFPDAIIRYVKCDMSDFQYKSYLTVLASEEKEKKKKEFRKGGILDLPNNFFIGTRIVSNIAFPNRSINDEGFQSFKGAKLQQKNLEQFSTKFHKIMQKISRAWGKIFIYSNFKEFGGIKSFVKVLEAQGYYSYTNYGEGKKRYAIWSGDEKTYVREQVKKIFNQPNNINGSKLKIIIGSPSSKEGLSFTNVQQVHILEPYWNESRIQQIIGRAIRFCSHKTLPEEKRKVRVFIYMATHPDEVESIDQYILRMSQQKQKLIDQFEMALKEAAIDCTLFKHGNMIAGEEDLTCGI